jgi:hypothetical protein
MKKLLFLIPIFAVLLGCEQKYRYPCHDPAKWNTERCQKPLCEINKDCPEHVLKGANGNGNNYSNYNFTPAPANQCNLNSNRSVSRSDQKGACR